MAIFNREYSYTYVYSWLDVFGEVPDVGNCRALFAGRAGYTGLAEWATDIEGDSVIAANVNELLSMISGRNPDVYEGKTEAISESDEIAFCSRFWSWVRETEPEKSMRLALLDETADQLLQDVETVTTSAREKDTDDGRDTSAESDMPITSTFANSLASPDTLQDKLSRLSIAEREYSHTWSDRISLSDPRGTLPERIDEAISVYRSIMKEWVDEFMDRFAIIGEEQDEIFE